MGELIDRFSNFVKGCITGFDRIVFKGMCFQGDVSSFDAFSRRHGFLPDTGHS